MTTINLEGLDVARVVALLTSLEDSRARDARFYRGLQRAACVEEHARATSDVVLVRAVLDRIEGESFRLLKAGKDERSLMVPGRTLDDMERDPMDLECDR